MCCSQEAHSLCVKSVKHTEWKVSMRYFQSLDCCDGRAGLGGERTAWGGTARLGGLCSSGCAASLREGLGEPGTPAPCDATCCPQSHLPSRLPLLQRVLAPGQPQLQLGRARPPGLSPQSSCGVLSGHSACPPPLPVRTASCHRLFLPICPPLGGPSVLPRRWAGVCPSLRGPCLLWATALTA